MKNIFAGLSILSGLFFAFEKCNADDLNAARGLIARMTEKHAADFSVEQIPTENERDVFEIESKDGRIILRGNNGVSGASALNWYLKNFAQCDISWCGDQLNLPAALPRVPKNIHVVNPHQRRVYFNYCTLSYTASWWDWERWQREIDFMAMNGINMPLCPVGLEGMWYNTLLKYGFTDAGAREFLVGPCFFAWQWMTNIEGHGGPLPKSWIDSHVELGRKILARERELGMTPIQQGFSGYVPHKLKEQLPDAAIAQQPNWCGFPGSTQLDPLDPLFPKIGRTFLEEEIKLFGTSHVYGADPFHESSPPKPGDEYLQKVGQTIIALMTNVDPQATWAMQAWSIRKGIATAVPKDKLLVLDLGGGNWHTFELDVTPSVKQEGEYEIRFQYESGGKRLEIRSLALVQAGNEIVSDKHEGRTGNEHINNVYRLKLGGLAFGTKYTLRAEIRTDGGNDSNGTIWLRRL